MVPKCMFVCLSVSLSVCRQNAYTKSDFLSNLELWSLLTTGRPIVIHGFFKEPIIGPIKFKNAEIRHLENREIPIFQRKIIRLRWHFMTFGIQMQICNLRQLRDQILKFYKFKMADGRLSWPSWLTYSGRFTHISGQAQDRESSPVKDRRSTAAPRNQPSHRVSAPSGEHLRGRGRYDVICRENCVIRTWAP